MAATSTAADANVAEVLRAIAARADPDGFVPFDRVMDEALFGPAGYYQRAASPFGAAGDFYTAPQVHPVFARTVARRAVEVANAMEVDSVVSVADLGCGDGTLLAGVAEALEARPDRARFRYVAIDRAEARRANTVARVQRRVPSAAERLRDAATVSEVGPLSGLAIAHELLDAQPAKRWRWDGTQWHELGVHRAANGLVEAESARPVVARASLPVLDAGRAGSVVETSPVAEALVREVADHWASGLFVVVDYGAEGPELAAGHPHGTLAAVRDHRSVPWDLATAGATDLSVFVNFSRIRAAARQAGWVELAYRRQNEALAAWGFAAELEAAIARSRSSEEEVRVRLAAKNLLFGFETFRVLELAAPASAAALGPATSASGAGSS